MTSQTTYIKPPLLKKTIQTVPAIHTDIIDQFKRVMAEHGLVSNDPINSDGELHRFHVEGDKQGSLNGHYTLHLDSIPAGSFGSWKTGVSESWCSKSSNQLTSQEKADYSKRIEADKQSAFKNRCKATLRRL